MTLALQLVQAFNVGALDRFLEHAVLDPFEFRLELLDHREVAVHHGIHQGVHHE